jgi:hypothetical protein
MIPDNQLSADFKLGFFASLFLTLMIVGLMNAGYAPVDYCANTVKDSLSQKKQSMLTSEEVPVSYNDLVDWCNDHLTDDQWRDELESMINQKERENDYAIPDYYTY